MPRGVPCPRALLLAALLLAAVLAAAQLPAQTTAPAPDPAAVPAPIAVDEDLRYSEACPDPRRNRLDLYRPAADRAEAGGAPPLVVFVHGGSWMGGDKEGHAFIGRAFANEGIACAVINYRLFPFARWPAFAEDAAAAFAWLHDRCLPFAFDPARMFLMGHSAGGQIAAAVACDPQWLAAHGKPAALVRGFIGLSGVYDVRPEHATLRAIFGATAALRAGASAMVSVDRSDPPGLVLWAERDLERLDLTGRMFAAHLRTAGVPVRARELPREDHVGYLFRFGAAQRDVVGPDVFAFVRSPPGRAGEGGDGPAASPEAVEVRTGLRYRQDGGDGAHVFDLYRPAGARAAPLLVLVHGGGWTGGDRRDLEPLARQCAQLGLAVAAIDHRLAPAHPHPAAALDVAEACAWLHEAADDLGCDPRRIHLGGVGSGGHLALLVGLDRHWLDEVGAPRDVVQGVAAVSAICDVRGEGEDLRRVFGDDEAARELASPVRNVPARARPVLLLWGDRDAGRVRTQNRVMAGRLGETGRQHLWLEVPGTAAAELDDAAWRNQLAALLAGFVGP